MLLGVFKSLSGKPNLLSTVLLQLQRHSLDSFVVVEAGAGKEFSAKALELTFHLGLKWFGFGCHPGLTHKTSVHKDFWRALKFCLPGQ